jgi:RHS repeat-associated protein
MLRARILPILAALLCCLLPSTNLLAQEPDTPPVLYQAVRGDEAPPAANPADGIALVEPPTANASGSANLEFPIKLPPGRQGMEPLLSISYNSDHQHGWLGRGWDLSLPSIEVETRWGVPRFDAENESETYLLEGAMLAPVAHRGATRPRTAEVTFRPRVESEFRRIIRHGNNPRNYWWEIQYPDGMTEYYGGLPESGIVASALLTDPRGNIASWAILRAVDVHGNRIDYHHQNQQDPGRTGTAMGKHRYPDYLTYTGFGEEEGAFRVDFIRDRQLGEPRRPDVRIDYMPGYKSVIADLLRRIEVRFRGEIVRSYELEFITGAFRQSLLESLAELGNDGSEMYRHNFDYFELNEDKYGPEESWSVGNDNVKGDLINPIPGFTSEISALGGAKSNSTQIGSAVTVGPIGSPGTKDFTVGGTVGSGSSEANGMLAFVDINGDLLPDKVFRQGNNLRWRKNLAGTGARAFGPVRPVNGIRDFSVIKTSETNFGFEANITPFFAGYENTTARTTTSTYFSDFNGDDLVDIAHRGRIYFNALDNDGNPTFTLNSGNTPSPIVAGADPDGELVSVDPQEQLELINMTPKHDVVRSWEAPFAGLVNISGTVQLLDDPGLVEYTREDGVSVTIQSGVNELYRQRINAGDFTPYTPTGVNNVLVFPGQKIYFRVQSIFDGAFDRVQWDPVITYVGQDQTEADADDLAQFQYRASEDFLLASCQTVAMPFDGTVDLLGTFSKPAMNDTLYLELLREGVVLLSRKFEPEAAFTDLPVAVSGFQVQENDEVQLRLRANGNVNWRLPKWAPLLVYSAADDGTPVTAEDGSPLYSYCPAIDYGMYTKTLRRAEVWTAQSNVYNVSLNVPARNFLPDFFQEVSFTVKGRDTLYLQRDTTMAADGGFAFSLVGQCAIPANDSVWIEAFFTAQTGVEGGGRSTFTVTDTLGNVIAAPFGLFRQRTTEEMTFGPQFRGWGQFVYRGAGAAADAPINEALLVLQNPDIDEEDVEDIEIDPDNPDFSEFEGLTDDPTSENFIVMVADPKEGNWRGYDDLTLVGQNYQSSSRLGEDDVLLTPEVGTGGGAPSLSSLAKIEAVAAGAGFGPASLAGSIANNTTTNLLEVMDLNGDRYPDLVTPTRAQYTTVYGGLSERSFRHGYGNHVAKSRAVGGTAGGKFVDSSPTNGGDGSGKGSRKRFRKAKAVTKNQGAKAQSANESAEAGGSISVQFSRDEDYVEHSWFDINGDGLIDKVWRNGDVALNRGYSFGPRENWGFTDIRRGVSFDLGGGGGINVSNNSFAAGFAITRTDNYSTVALQDINGDGLADALSYNPDTRILRARLNTGTGFSGAIDWARLAGHLDEGDATSESANFAFTVCIPIFFIRICVNPSGSTGRGVSRVLSQFNDINGDGFLDELRSTRDNELKVKPSTIGKTNLLRRVRRPLGGTMELDFASAGNEYGIPFPKWLLAETRFNDGVSGDGPEWRKTTFQYSAPNHQRNEREFFGFGRTEEIAHDTERGDAIYRKQVTEYHNDHFYHRGLPTRQYTETTDGGKYRETVFRYLMQDPETGAELPPNLLDSDNGMAFPVLVERIENYYEGGTEVVLSQRTSFQYDSIGQVLIKTEFGDGTPEDELRTEYTYHTNPDNYQQNRPASIRIFSGGELKRHTELSVDERGNYLQIRHYLDEETFAPHDFTYDQYGNVTSTLRPPNANGERMGMTYTYDPEVVQYIEETEDAYGYQSTASYDFRYGQKLSETDINGHRVDYQIDAHGRVEEIRLPKDSTWSFRYSYAPMAAPAHALTERYDPTQNSGVMSGIFLDGLGRIIQQQHASRVGNNLGRVISGRKTYDAFDRAVREAYPTFQRGTAPGFVTAPASSPQSSSTHDEIDRPISLTMPDGSVSTMTYGFATAPDGQLRFQEKMTDALGFSETTLTDERGQHEAYLREADTTEVITTFRYNSLGERLAVIDDGGFETTFTYDMLGRKIAETPANSGRVDYLYDLADNMTAKQTPNLRELLNEEGYIRYFYDHERLRGIIYPINFQNKVEIAYGGPGARFNRAGRVVLRQDASGGEEFFYDEHGETSKTIRTLLINESTVRTFVSEAVYDSWGREAMLGYPDGEWLSYFYDAAGMLRELVGEKDGNTYQYVSDITYDEFGRQTALKFGNGTEETITFEPRTRRPERLTLTGADRNLQDLQLEYDVVGNLLSAQDNTAPGADGLGGSHQQQFYYDPLHRLTEATGNHTFADETSQYSYFGGYDDLYNQTARELTLVKNGGTDSLGSYQQELKTSAQHPHRVDELGGRKYTYDANGNLLGYAGEAGSYRYQQARWDEENRMTEFSDNGTISRYTYAADGTRVIRSEGRLKGVFTDGAPTGFLSHGSNYVAYVSPFFTVQNRAFTKHIFLGSRRILSKEGTGEFNNTYRWSEGLTAGDLNYTARMNDLTQTVWNYYLSLGLPPGPPTLPGYYGQPEQTGNPLPTSEGGIFGSPPSTDRPGPSGPPDTSGPPGPPTWYVSGPERDSIGAGFGYQGFGVFPEVIQSYYHTDQLGNVTWTTDNTGRATGFRSYLPNGELLQASNRKAPPLEYAFNGKERDASSGLDYFGARYLDAEASLWLSPDPLDGAFPGHNPYAFALHNPLRFADPDGREAWDYFSTELEAAKDFARIYNERSIFHNYEFGTNIYRTTLNGKRVYYYDSPVTDLDDSGVSLPPILPFGEVVADIHTHSRMEVKAQGYLEHSHTDLDGNDENGRPGYVANPRGELRRYNPRTGKTKIVATGLPHDELFYGPVVTEGYKKQWRKMNYSQVAGQMSTEHTGRQGKRNARRYSGKPLSKGYSPRKRWGWHAALQRKPSREARRE